MSTESTISKQLPAMEGWFTWPPNKEPHLIGSKCESCGDYFFPKVKVCANPECMSSDIEEVLELIDVQERPGVKAQGMRLGFDDS